MNCICGHPDHDHGPSGRCRVPDCPCEQFQPAYPAGARTGWTSSRVVGRGTIAPVGETRPPHHADSPVTIRRVLIVMAALAFTCSPGLSRRTGAAEPLIPPASFAEIAARARAASVVIRASAADAVAADALSVPAGLQPDEDIQEDGWEPVDALAARRNRTVGAGVIVDPRGIALTSARAVLRARPLEVALIDGTPLKAVVVGLDRDSDVAVLRLENGGGLLPHLPLGDSERLKIGDWVISVGAPLGLEGTVTAGVIAATPTPASSSAAASYLQIDAAMGRGNAGGPLVNLSGEVVGLGTVLDGAGVAYAIPSTTVRRVYLDLLEKGRVSRPWLGIVTQSLTPRLARALRAPGDAGVLIAEVPPEGPGARAGLRPGDIVLEIGTTPISSRAQLERIMTTLAPGEVVKLRLRRDGRDRTVSVGVGEEPDGRPHSPALALARRRLGLEVHRITGVVARDLDLGGSAARAGIRSGDVIHEVNRQPVRSAGDFEAIVRMLTPGAPVLMRVQRRDVVLYIVVDTRE